MPVLLHQNLRLFGGGSQDRNHSYHHAFTRIARQLAAPGGDGPAWVAGGTEIVNHPVGLRSWETLCPALGLRSAGVVACGQTSLAAGPEFVGLAVHPDLSVLSIGRIFPIANRIGVTLHHDLGRPADPDWSTRLPTGLTHDFRGAVYVVVGSPLVPPLAVGFLPSRYTYESERSLLTGRIPDLIAAIQANPAMRRGAGRVFLGGGIAAAPSERAFGRHAMVYEYAHRAASAELYHLPATAGSHSSAATATMADDPSDCWYANINPAAPGQPVAPGGLMPPTVQINTATLDLLPGQPGTMSDQAATLLRVA